MGQLELKIAVMAGIVLALFLTVGEIAALRKRVAQVRERWREYYRRGRFARLLAELCGVMAFFLIQPLLIGLLVVMVLDNFNPKFSQNTLQQLQRQINAHTK